MIVLGVDQALRHTGLVAVEIREEGLDGDFLFRMHQVNVPSRDLSEINDVFASTEAIMERVKSLVGQEREVCVVLESPLQEVRIKPEENSRWRGGAWATNNQLAQLFGFLTYSFVRRGWRTLSVHPSLMRSFFGPYKSDSINRAEQWQHLFREHTEFTPPASWQSDHVCEAMFFCLFGVYLLAPRHPAVRMDAFYLEPIRRAMLKHEEKNYINWELPSGRTHGEEA